MPQYTFYFEIIRGYHLTVTADSSEEAERQIYGMTTADIERRGELSVIETGDEAYLIDDDEDDTNGEDDVRQP